MSARSTLLTCLSLIVFLTSQALALDPARLAGDDRSKPAARKGAAIRAEAVTALETLQADTGTTWSVRWNEETGLPAVVRGAGTEPMGSEPEESARSFVESYPGLFGLSAGADDLKTVVEQESLAGRHVRFRQHHRGIPVWQGDVSVHMDEALRVQWVNSNARPALGEVATSPELSRERALELARGAAGVSGALRAPARLETVVHVSDGEGALAWAVSLPAWKPLGDFQVILDARTGQVRSLENVMRHARARVFSPNPVVALKNNTIRDQNDSAGHIGEAAYQIVELKGLDGSGKLKGQFVDAAAGALAVEEPEAAGDFLFDRSQKAFEQAMVYFHIDRAQRYFQSLGFTNANNRVQKADAHGTTQDNSWYSPMTKQLTFGDGGVDDAEDADIVMHEYGHSTQDNQVPGFGSQKEGRAMGEGFGDYLATTLRADHSFQLECVGSWDGVSYSNDNPPCLRRMDSTKHYPEDMEGEEHADGELWSAALFQVWKKLGKETADKLVLEHHFLLSPNAKFTDAANALLQADRNVFGGAHVPAIKQIMAARGFLQLSGTLRVALRQAGTGHPCGGKVLIEGRQPAEVDPSTGVLQLDLAPGSYQVQVKSFGYVTLAPRAVTVVEDEVVSIEEQLALAPRHKLSGRVVSAATGEAVSARIIVADTPLDPVQTAGDAGTFSIELPAGVYTLKAVAFGYRPAVRENVDVTADASVKFELAGLPPVLLVADDEGGGFQAFYTQALEGTAHDVWDVAAAGSVTAETLLGYGTVVWFTGNDSARTFEPSDQELVKQYVDSGGRLFATGQEIGYHLKGTPFYRDVLGAEFVDDATPSREVSGAGHQLSIEGGDGAGNQRYPDVVKPAIPEAEAMLAYGDGTTAALRVARGTGKVVYFGFGFEGISSKADRASVMRTVLDTLKPSLSDRVARLAKIDESRRAAGPAGADRWMALEEEYEKLMAREASKSGSAQKARLRGLLSSMHPLRFRNLEAVLDAR